jgi:DNA-binding YbaB/EbfC family protein
MKFPGGGFNPQQMMKQAQQMQEKMMREMENLIVEATVGGGAVSVQMRGTHEVVAVKISEEAMKDSDAEMLGDLLVAALNEANRKIEESLQGKLGGMLPF